MFCVKWEGCSYRRRSWETEEDVKAAYKAASKLQSFKRRMGKDLDACEEPFPSDYLVVDRVLDSREDLPAEERDDANEKKDEKKDEGKEEEDDSSRDESDSEELGTQYLVKWKGLGYSEATWEAAADLSSEADLDAVRRHERREDLKAKKAVHKDAVERAKAGTKPPLKPDPPAFKNDMSLREYQVTSFEWMVGNYRRRKNVILGDEMGLGKTAQCVAVMEHVRTTHLRAPRPFLVIAPLTTLGHWKREMERWTEMNVVVLDGNAEDRRVCEETEFYFEARGAKGPAKFDVMLVSFETARRLTDTMNQFEWAMCVVDEAHKLKDVNSQTTQAVMDIGYDWLLLLTGTPIQNNVKELFGMMHVLDPETYPSWEEFQDEFCDGGKEVDAEQVLRLREVLKPRMLRRMKEDVETIPAKEEIVVWVELTPEQRNYYRAIYEKQVHVLLEGAKSKNVPQLRNLCMELRKVCNHPFLCDGLEEDYAAKKRKAIEAAAEKAAQEAVARGEEKPATAVEMPSALDMLTHASGKMVLVSKLLPKLKSQGKKVLIFSQFTIVLDILEDYLSMNAFEFERLDGSTSQADRQAGIDRFNRPGQGFVYLLSTRAGGMGITLTAADTAIIYDSDWNPQNDLQAMARCHRIGQTKEVKVYRLVTKATYEQSLFETSAKKYGLDEAVLGGGDGGGTASGKTAKEDAAQINKLLKYGVHGALRDQAGEEAAKFESEDIDHILKARAESRAIGHRAGNTFSTATFNADDGNDLDAEEFWLNALPDAARRAREAALNPDPHAGLDGRFRVEGPRKRRGMYDSYKEGANGLVGKRRRRGDDDDWDGGGSGSGSEEEEEDRETRGAKRASKSKLKASKLKAQRLEQWRDHELKTLEDAMYSFGVGSDRACARAATGAGLDRPLRDVRAVALCLADMMARAAKVNKARFDELEKEAAEAGPVARCAVCESMKKGRCGTETAPRSCLKLSDELKRDMDESKDERGEGGVPVGMSRATWERTVEACQAAIDARRAQIPEHALPTLERNNLYKRLASGWQRATKCARERGALSKALEIENAEGAAPEGSPGSSSVSEEIIPPPLSPEESAALLSATPALPEERPRADAAARLPVVQRGALPEWWSPEVDADLLRGSLRHGFSPWSAEALEDQFEAIRTDPDLCFARDACEPADPEEDDKAGKASASKEAAAKEEEEEKEASGGEEEKDASERTAAGASEKEGGPRRMPGRETLKRRVLKLLDALLNPRAPPAPRGPTKKERLAAEREEKLRIAAEARKARDVANELERQEKERLRAEKAAEKAQAEEEKERLKAEAREAREAERAAREAARLAAEEEKAAKKLAAEEEKAAKKLAKVEEKAAKKLAKVEEKAAKKLALEEEKAARKAAFKASLAGKKPKRPSPSGDASSEAAKKIKKPKLGAARFSAPGSKNEAAPKVGDEENTFGANDQNANANANVANASSAPVSPPRASVASAEKPAAEKPAAEKKKPAAAKKTPAAKKQPATPPTGTRSAASSPSSSPTPAPPPPRARLPPGAFLAGAFAAAAAADASDAGGPTPAPAPPFARRRGGSLDANSDPLATLVLPSLNRGTAADAINIKDSAVKPRDRGPGQPPPGGFKRAGASASKAAKGPHGGAPAAPATDSKQRSLFGFFSKTPAPSGAGDRKRAVNTPTTGGFPGF